MKLFYVNELCNVMYYTQYEHTATNPSVVTYDILRDRFRQMSVLSGLCRSYIRANYLHTQHK